MLDRIEEAIVAQNAAAIRMRVSELFGKGKPFSQAKVEALKGYGMEGIPPHLRGSVAALVEAMQPVDLYPADLRASGDRSYRSYVAGGLLRDTWINRTLFRLFGVTL